ncbi:3-oxoacyl-[acyl-carrier-protein] synthase III [Candidatus Filomicrobium marinum]|uniref:Beta-ketoacyl-[acyl-carrier-protein] synthase III n=2 Tax=Filomicrobium TaxID=119044 RepID=A0A0D6JHR5_9HYPH|nr:MULTISPECIES: beta-ketoacyl-ACP synthase III [Filomicrobium]MCV0369683.1 ketoacyl-ACP synthase III [Filomicrobium sp.]CFX47806.1 3-oxoacyl-[acyl-carrier-protein] synthase III [Candidatus Filomicrobium marinum]CPR20491.1 3-oxoacyl-[acyl-carrier-protein] synthase III [Candidatus Filomicrobium marinum]SDP15873.1 3-oxoacyl-[acyl-carrier-protein] synthase-3 [Filomicrobium insigne]
MAVIRSIVRGVGAYVPSRVVTNAELAERIDTSDEWIVERSGIRQRHIAAKDETTSDLGLAAARQALVRSAIDPVDIDLVICATATPDRTFPSTAVRIQAALGITKGAAFDVQAVCSGFIYAMSIADNFLKAGQSRRALVIGAETFSRILDWEDRSTCVLFGDGAGAVVLEALPQHGDRNDRGILSTRIRSDGRFEDLLYVDGGPGSTGTVGHLRMNGREVFRHAIQKISGVIEETLLQAGYASDEIDLFVPHQANKRILDGIAKKLNVPPERIVMTLDRHGNTSAASIPLALNHAFEHHLLGENKLVLLEAMGGGFTWGAILVRW